MNLFKIFRYLLLSFIAVGLQSCGDDNGTEPTVNDIKGTWLLTHFSYKYHYLQNDTWWEDSKEEYITSSYWWDNPMGIEPTKYMEHLTFNTKDVFVWLSKYPLPTMPRVSQYDISTPEGQTDYELARENWHEAISCINEGFPWQCPYSLKGNKLYIGSLYSGDIEFLDSESFTLTYKDTAFDMEGEYKLYVYSFKKNF